MNVVLICSDTFRWDYLGCYGNGWIQTPHLDRLARESVLFLDAFAEGLPTIPVRRVLLTGRRIVPFKWFPQKSDLVGLPGWHPLFDEDVTLSEVLQEQDYTTCFVNDTYHMMKPGKNFHRGFDCWYWIRGQESDPYQIRDAKAVQHLLDECTGGAAWAGRKKHWITQHLMNRETWRGEEDTNVARAMTKAADWVTAYDQSNCDEPFFLYVDVFDPHEPWDPPVEYARLYRSDYEGVGAIVPPGTKARMSEDEFEQVKAAYAGEVTLTDRWVGHLLDTLRDRGLMDDTIVVFTSDHGTMMGEQDEIHKGADRLRNQVTQVPLIIRHPRGEGAGKRIGGFVQHQDIMPTILNLLGVPNPDRVQGDDLWPSVAGRKAQEKDRILSAFGRYASVRTAHWNYMAPWAKVSGKARVELYDLTEDPEELTNVIDAHPDVAKELDSWMRETIKSQSDETGGSIGPSIPVPIEDQALV